MTQPEASAPPPSPPPAAPVAASEVVAVAPGTNQPAHRSKLARAFQWLWRGPQVKSALQAWKEQRARVGALEDRARLLFECAARLEHPAEKLSRSTAPVVAELYAQSASIAGLALARLRDEAPAEEPSLEVWLRPADEQDKLVAEQRARARALLRELELPLRARDGLVLQRALRVGGVVISVVAVLAGVSAYYSGLEQRRDLAAGKPWRASSTYNNMGCTSPQQQCSESPDFFFHTREEPNSWVEIDLGSPMTFTAVRIVNRRDCCFERAVPLIVEVSDRQDGFREVTRRTASFNSWLGTFAPTQARYVRVRTPSRTSLHLAQLRVLR